MTVQNKLCRADRQAAPEHPRLRCRQLHDKLRGSCAVALTRVSQEVDDQSPSVVLATADRPARQ